MYHPSAYQVPPPTYRPVTMVPPPELEQKIKIPLFLSTPTKLDSRNHSRSASHVPSSAFSYSSPQQLPQYFTPPTYTYPSPVPYTTKQAIPKQRDDFAAATDRMRSKANRQTDSRAPKSQGKNKSPSRSQHVKVTINDHDVSDYEYHLHGSPPPPYNEDAYHHQYPSVRYTQTQTETYKQVDPPIYRVRSRAASHPQQPQRHVSRATRRYTPDSPPKATADDAARAGIPAGYSYKNWDPTEEPIFLLGSVFDANSLGKWIYDWTVFHHGPSTPMADLAGELWLGLIELASKIKRAEECLPRIRRLEDRDLVDDFLESGERLWSRLGKILKACEDYMWRAAKKQNGGKKSAPAMGSKSGCEFVDSIFGRDRKLEETEKLMTGIRLWTMRFDANCEDILRHPNA